MSDLTPARRKEAELAFATGGGMFRLAREVLAALAAAETRAEQLQSDLELSEQDGADWMKQALDHAKGDGDLIRAAVERAERAEMERDEAQELALDRLATYQGLCAENKKLENALREIAECVRGVLGVG